VRTGSPTTRRGRADGAGEGLRGRNPDPIQSSGNVGANPSLSDPTSHQTLRGGASKGGEDRESHHPEGKNGWRGGRSEGAQSRPDTIFRQSGGALRVRAAHKPISQVGYRKGFGATGNQSRPNSIQPLLAGF